MPRTARTLHRVYWVANKDGVAHAQRMSSGSRTVCDRAGLPERYAWPRVSECAACVDALAREVATARR